MLASRGGALVSRRKVSSSSLRFLSSKPPPDGNNNKKDHHHDDLWDRERINAFVGHTFPDFVEGWNRDTFKTVGRGMAVATVALGIGGATLSGTVAAMAPAAVLGALTAGYWRVGLKDMKQSSHAVRRNYPVLGNIRYIMETVSPSLCRRRHSYA